MKRRSTIRDVAREAGVSHQTVSRVLNNKSEISPDTRNRVLQAIQKLNYRPSRTAQSLARQRGHTIGLVVPNIANPYFAEVTAGVQEVARTYDYNVFLCNTEWRSEEELRLLYSLASQPVDGIILCGARSSDKELTAFCDYFKPVVLNGRIFEHSSTSMVRLDLDPGMDVAVKHLVAQGHRAIGMLAGPLTPPTMSNALRVAGFCRALETHGLPVYKEWIARGPLAAEGGHKSARRLLTTYPEITALVAHNDLVAIGAIKACQGLGRRIPEECAIVGFNDIDLATMVTPTLTSVHVDMVDLGRQLMMRLVAMMEQPEENFSPLILPVNQLFKRESA